VITKIFRCNIPFFFVGSRGERFAYANVSLVEYVRVSIRFRFGFFKYPFYSRIPVLLVLLYAKLKLLLSLGRYSS
jgi:hypothetical protein